MKKYRAVVSYRDGHGKLLTIAEMHDGIESIKVYEISVTAEWDIDPRSL